MAPVQLYAYSIRFSSTSLDNALQYFYFLWGTFIARLAVRPFLVGCLVCLALASGFCWVYCLTMLVFLLGRQPYSLAPSLTCTSIHFVCLRIIAFAAYRNWSSTSDHQAPLSCSHQALGYALVCLCPVLALHLLADAGWVGGAYLAWVFAVLYFALLSASFSCSYTLFSPGFAAAFTYPLQ